MKTKRYKIKKFLKNNCYKILGGVAAGFGLFCIGYGLGQQTSNEVIVRYTTKENGELLKEIAEKVVDGLMKEVK